MNDQVNFPVNLRRLRYFAMRQKSSNLSWVIILALFFSGCVQREDTDLNSTLPPLMVAVTEEPLPFSSLTPAPPSPTPFPIVPLALSEDAQLRVPDPVLLLRGLDLLLDNPAAHRSRIDLSQFGTELVVEDLNRYYPDGVPHAAGIDLSGGLSWASPELVRPILQTRVVQYLNALSVDLVAEPFHRSWAYQIEAHLMSDIGEPVKILLVVRDRQRAPYVYMDLLVPVKVDAEGRYVLVTNDFPFYSGASLYAPTTTVYGELDFLEMSSAEFLIHQKGHSGGSHNYYDFYLFDWDEEGVFVLDEIKFLFNIRDHHEQVYPEHTFGDFVDNGQTDLKIMRVVNGFFGCRYPLETTYFWSTEGFSALVSEIPDTPECNAHQWYVMQVEPADARPFLTRAIEQWSHKPPPSEDLLTYLQLQQVFLHSSLGEQGLAEQSFAQLLARPPSQAFGSLFDDHAATNDELNVSELCNLINEHVEGADFGQINPYLYAPRFSPGSIFNTEGCNQRILIEGLVRNLEMPVESRPDDVLQAAGVNTGLFKQLDLEEDGSLEWVGIVTLDRSALFVIWQGNDTYWHPTLIDYIPDADAQIGSLEAVVRDFNNDGLADIGYLLGIVGQECETDFRLAIHPWLRNQDDLEIYHDWGCGERSLADFEFANGDFVLPDWYTLPAFMESDQTLPELLADLTHWVSAQSEPERNTAIIEQLLDFLPSDSNEAQRITEYLYYLRGLNYELMGESKLAVESYLMLLDLDQRSPWSWMAAARLSG